MDGTEPAFPMQVKCQRGDHPDTCECGAGSFPGISQRDMACIHLRVAASDKPWLNDLIKQARRQDLAMAAMQAITITVWKDEVDEDAIAADAQVVADQMLQAEGNEG